MKTAFTLAVGVALIMLGLFVFVWHPITNMQRRELHAMIDATFLTVSNDAYAKGLAVSSNTIVRGELNRAWKDGFMTCGEAFHSNALIFFPETNRGAILRAFDSNPYNK